MKSDASASAIESHYVKWWGKPLRRETIRSGPVHELPPDFEVLVFQRAHRTVYATKCMSLPTDTERIELNLHTEPSLPFQPELVELMTVVAYFHRTGASLGLEHTVNFGRPWIAGATCSFGLIALPYGDGPKFEWMTEPRVRLLWLIPITERERAFKKSHGAHALYERFEEWQVSLLDPSRESVV